MFKNLKFNFNEHTFGFKSDSLAAKKKKKKKGCTKTNTLRIIIKLSRI